MSMLEQGKKVRCKSWPNSSYVCKGFEGLISIQHLNYDDAFKVNDEWEEYIEPKKKRIVKMWPAVTKIEGNSYYISTVIYETFETAKRIDPYVVRLATEYPPIEIEIEMETDE